MKLPAVCITLFSLITNCHSFYDYRLTKSVLDHKNIKTLLILLCETTTHLIDNHRNDDTWISTVDISNETEVNFEKFLIRLSSTHLVVSSLMCYQSVKVLSEISKLTMFHGERHWLLFSDSLETSIGILREQNINSDAEITLALTADNQR